MTEGAVAEVPARGPPENQGKWTALTSEACSKARFQASDMLTRLANYEMAEAADKKAAVEQEAAKKEKVKDDARKRIKKHEVVVVKSIAAITTIEEAMQKLEDTLTRLTHERYARFADAQVNQRRSEIRAKRPAAESFKDQLQKDLEAEKDCLVKSRAELLEREKEVKKFHEEFAVARKELSFDTGARRLQVELETHCLKPTCAPSGVMAKKPEGEEDPNKLPPIAGAAPASPSGGAAPDPASPAAAKAEAKPKAEAKAAATPKAGETPASPTAAEGEEVVVAEGEAPGSPSNKKKKGLGPKERQVIPCPPLEGPESLVHINKTEKLLTQVQSFIDKSDDCIQKSKKAADLARDSVNKSLAKRCMQLAQMKAHLESHIGDVTYAIQTAESKIVRYEARCDPNDKTKVAKIEGAKKLLETLLASKATLQQDLHGKIDALNIDNSCRRVTPQVASEKRPASASGKKKGQKALANSASAPNLAATEGGAEGEAAPPADAKTPKAAEKPAANAG